MTWREGLLAAALAIFAVGFVFNGIGNDLLANASAHANSVSQFTTGHRLAAISGWVLCAAAAACAVGFLVSTRARAVAAAAFS